MWAFERLCLIFQSFKTTRICTFADHEGIFLSTCRVCEESPGIWIFYHLYTSSISRLDFFRAMLATSNQFHQNSKRRLACNRLQFLVLVLPTFAAIFHLIYMGWGIMKSCSWCFAQIIVPIDIDWKPFTSLDLPCVSSSVPKCDSHGIPICGKCTSNY